MWYAYAVCAGESRLNHIWPHGLTADMAVQALAPAPGMFVLASEVPDSLFLPAGDGNSTSPAEDPEWIAQAALAHHEVVAAAHSVTDVLPLRFGTVFRSKEEILAHFEQALPELQPRLDSIAGCQEVELAMVIDAQRMEQLLMPQLAPYMSASEFQGELSERMAATAQLAWAHLESELSAEIRGRFLCPEGTCAYLVKRNTQAIFEFVEKTKGQGTGIHFEVAGLWPPYNFAGGDVTVALQNRELEAAGSMISALSIPTDPLPVGAA